MEQNLNQSDILKNFDTLDGIVRAYSDTHNRALRPNHQPLVLAPAIFKLAILPQRLYDVVPDVLDGNTSAKDAFVEVSELLPQSILEYLALNLDSSVSLIVLPMLLDRPVSAVLLGSSYALLRTFSNYSKEIAINFINFEAVDQKTLRNSIAELRATLRRNGYIEHRDIAHTVQRFTSRSGSFICENALTDFVGRFTK